MPLKQPGKFSVPDAANDPSASRFRTAREAARYYLKALDAHRLRSRAPRDYPEKRL
jgi:hypothetical protein